MARFSEGPVANLLCRNKKARAARLVGVLRGISYQSMMSLLDEGSDIDDEAGAHIGVEAGIDDLEGPVRDQAGIHLGKAGEEAGLVAKRGCGGVVGVPGLPVGEDHDAGAKLAQNPYDPGAVFQGVFNRAVGQVESLPPSNTPPLRGLRSA